MLDQSYIMVTAVVCAIDDNDVSVDLLFYIIDDASGIL